MTAPAPRPPEEDPTADWQKDKLALLLRPGQERLPHPAIVCGGPQLLKVIEDMEAGTMPLPDQVIWREDLDGELQVRLARACGGTDDQIAAIRAVLAAEAENASRRLAGGESETPT